MSKTESPKHSGDPLIRRLLGFFLFPFSLFPFLALASYNWRDIEELCMPPVRPPMNLIGVAGDYFAYFGYQFIGLSVWVVPLICVISAIIIVSGKNFRFSRRIVWLALLLLSVTCLFQLVGHVRPIAALLHSLNIAPNAGGAVGYIIMTRALAQYLSPFGAGVLMVTLLTLSIFMIIGPRNIISALAALFAWAADRTAPSPDTLAGEDNRRAAEAAAREAKEAAAAERRAEKQRIAEERAAREAERRAERAAREAERRAEREAREAELLRIRAEQTAARERLRPAAEPASHDDYFPPRPAKPAPKPEPPPPPAPAPLESAAPDPCEYRLPPVSLLNAIPPSAAVNNEDINKKGQQLIDTLKVFDVNASLAYKIPGPVVTQYAISLDLGTRVEKVVSLSRNLQMALQATSLRIEAPIPGQNAVGIEVPNANPASVSFREIIDGETWTGNCMGKFQIPLLLGKDAAGKDLVVDLAKIPHLLVAGATGQGKSVCLNSIIAGLLMCRTPEQLRFIMVDPKRVEFSEYGMLPHLLVPVIEDTNKVVFGLHWAVVEMDRRLKMFNKAKVRNIEQFNNRPNLVQPDLLGGEEHPINGDDETPRTIPYIVIIIDEVADIMQAAARDVEPLVARLTALARATGIHLILATQRPDTKVITGTIKSNIPGRISFKTSSSIDSRTILDATGSEDLIGKGDMLYKMPDGRLLRAQGSFISNEEIHRIIEFIGEQSGPQFDKVFASKLERVKEAKPANSLDDFVESEEPETEPEPKDPNARYEDLYIKAVEIMATHNRASASIFQRKLSIGFNTAARLVELMESRGVVSAPRPGANARDILVDPVQLLAQLRGESAAAAITPVPDQPAEIAEDEFENVETDPEPPLDDPFGVADKDDPEGPGYGISF